MGARPISRLRLSLPSLPGWPVLRRRLAVAGLVLLALAAAYFLWLRDSPFVRVRLSEVVVTGAEADRGAEAALAAAAAEMSTLDLDQDALRAAVADDPEVASVAAQADFPHGVTIEVELRRPAGYLEGDGGAIVAADGIVLARGLERPDGLALINVEPAALGDRAEGPALAVAEILGAAPEELAGAIESGRIDPEDGPIATLTVGLELRFGDPSQADLKWRAASAVLADPDFAGATYLDLSVPSRPVAG